MTDISVEPLAGRQRGILGAIERFGDRLPDPVMIFVWLIAAVMLLSVAGAALQWSAINPVSREVIVAANLFSIENLRKLIADMPRTLTGFAPLGYVLVVMLGAGVAERSGFFGVAMRALVKDAPKRLLTPLLVFAGILGHSAADAAFVVVVPLGGIVFAAAGRHPLAGICAAFAGVGGGFSANVIPSGLDALLLGLTEPAARLLDPGWTMNVAGNWWFILAMTFVFVPLAWAITDLIIEPRFGEWRPSGEAPLDASAAEITPVEMKGLALAGLTALVIVAAFAVLAYPPLWGGADAPLYDSTQDSVERALTPFFQGFIALFFFLFLFCGIVFGAVTGVIKSTRDIVSMMSKSMGDMAYYIVLAFTAAHFVALFNWSNLGIITAIAGAEGLRATGLPAPVLLCALVLLAAFLDLFIGSASAKWAMLAPVLVPMLMLLGISPEMTTAAYRMGDSVANIVTPLMVYFPLTLAFARRWDPQFGMGGLMAAMTPYTLWFLGAGLIMVFAWVLFGLPLGPGASIDYALPEAP
ncbi:MAG: AbgT family transporter [Hyphomonadaceae bacterium]